ncbi:exonuclease SbcCD subunit D [uncultured Helcococcus sp.]|uniref:exonuclease SbcCD subunit D n=1 Tax=uncultured Helcococcus sp. TaxID=1072508 RepID=UPI00288B4366|nr:exonuclease SbcCD subunit D [uncultured Helcococcus sp.]
MRFMHLADLHLGKNVNGYSLIKDQEYALNQIIKLIKKEKIETLLIAGDIYQSSIPSIEATKLFSKFLSQLKDLKMRVLIISGNHDSSDRLAYANSFLKDSEIYISDTYNGKIECVRFEDEYGPINFYLFPYLKPSDVRPYFEEKISSYEEAIRAVIDSIEINEDERNVILSHQFILNAELSDSEEIYAGLLEAVSEKLYDKFDYVALGHIHKKQNFLGGKARYPGALLKFSATEANYDKTITIVNLKEKNNLRVEEFKIDYMRDMRVIKGFYKDIIEASKNDKAREDYIYIELLDEDEIYDGFNQLRNIYPNIMTYKYKDRQVNVEDLEDFAEKTDNKTPLDLFTEFYQTILGKDITDDNLEIIKSEIEDIWGNDESN